MLVLTRSILSIDKKMKKTIFSVVEIVEVPDVLETHTCIGIRKKTDRSTLYTALQ